MVIFNVIGKSPSPQSIFKFICIMALPKYVMQFLHNFLLICQSTNFYRQLWKYVLTIKTMNCIRKRNFHCCRHTQILVSYNDWGGVYLYISKLKKYRQLYLIGTVKQKLMQIVLQVMYNSNIVRYTYPCIFWIPRTTIWKTLSIH